MLFAAAVALIAACSKDQQVANHLDGSWKAVSVITTFAGVTETQTDSLPTYTFTKCKVKDAKCDGTWRDADGTTGTFKWQITNKGANLLWEETESGVTTTYTGTVLEHSKTKFLYELTISTIIGDVKIKSELAKE